MQTMEDIERLAQEEIDLALENIADIDDFDEVDYETSGLAPEDTGAEGEDGALEMREGSTATVGESGASPSPERGGRLAKEGSFAKAAPTTSLSRAAFHIFKSNVGAGIFLLPTFYTNCGYASGMILAVLAGIILLDCTLMLLKAKTKINRMDVQTYPAVVKYVLGIGANNFVKFTLVMTQFGFCTMYIQYTASLCAELFPFYNAYYIFVVMSVAIVTPLTFLTGKLHLLAFASILASVCVFFCIFGTIYLSFDRLAENGRLSRSAEAATWPPNKWILFLAGHVMALEGIGVVLPVENSVKEKEKFPTVIRRTIGGIIVGFVFFGQVGYYAFGTHLKSSIVHAFKESIFTACLQLSLAVSLLLSYPIQYVPAIQIVDRTLKVKDPNSFHAKILRVALNFFFGLMATGVGGETLGLFAEFLGAFAGTHLTMTFPSLLTLLVDAATSGKKVSLSKKEYYMLIFKEPLTLDRFKCMCYFVFALIICIVGTGTVVVEGIELLTRPPPEVEKVVYVHETPAPDEIISTVEPLPTEKPIDPSDVPTEPPKESNQPSSPDGEEPASPGKDTSTKGGNP